jgi:hypothetical protein
MLDGGVEGKHAPAIAKCNSEYLLILVPVMLLPVSQGAGGGRESQGEEAGGKGTGEGEVTGA